MFYIFLTCAICWFWACLICISRMEDTQL